MNFDELLRASPDTDPSGGRAARVGQTCRSVPLEGWRPFRTPALLSLALACSSRRWLVLYARAPCRPVVEGQAQSNRAVSGSKFNERALRRAIRELRGTRDWSTSRVHVCTCIRVYVYTCIRRGARRRAPTKETHAKRVARFTRQRKSLNRSKDRL